MLHVNHQIRGEILPIFFENRTVEIHERSVEFTKTHDWLNRTPKHHLKLLRNIRIRLKDTEPRNYASPLPWLKAEEDVLPKEAKVLIKCHYNNTECIWKKAYELGRTCIDSGMDWVVVEKCLKHLEEAVDLTTWRDRPDELYDMDEFMSDMSESDMERRGYGGY